MVNRNTDEATLEPRSYRSILTKSTGTDTEVTAFMRSGGGLAVRIGAILTSKPAEETKVRTGGGGGGDKPPGFLGRFRSTGGDGYNGTPSSASAYTRPHNSFHDGKGSWGLE